MKNTLENSGLNRAIFAMAAGLTLLPVASARAAEDVRGNDSALAEKDGKISSRPLRDAFSTPNAAGNWRRIDLRSGESKVFEVIPRDGDPKQLLLKTDSATKGVPFSPSPTFTWVPEPPSDKAVVAISGKVEAQPTESGSWIEIRKDGSTELHHLVRSGKSSDEFFELKDGSLTAVKVDRSQWVRATPEEDRPASHDLWSRWTLGPRLSSPYAFHYDPLTKIGSISTSGTKTTAYLEYHLTNKWAWRSEAEAGDKFSWLIPDGLSDFIDLELKLGATAFNGGDDANAAQFSGGDISAETNLAIPLLHYAEQTNGDNLLRASIGPVYSAVHSTSLTDFKILRRHLIGAEGSLMYKTVTGLPVFFSMRYGWCYVDAVQFYDDPTVLHRIKLDGDRPEYVFRSARAVEAELIYPINKDSSFTVGARLYFGLHPDTWIAYLGYSISTDKLLRQMPTF